MELLPYSSPKPVHQLYGMNLWRDKNCRYSQQVQM
nr:MAG TPA: hypothetical protein [Crassvirales sp.]DAX57588.1 MAG TPA: hypothetical protein [Crassvirales sp.]